MRVAALAAVLLSFPASAAAGFDLRGAEVGPDRAYFAGKPVKVKFRASLEDARILEVRLVDKRAQQVVRRWEVEGRTGNRRYKVLWRGKLPRKARPGKVAPSGRYVARAGIAGRPTRKLGLFEWRRHAYPIDGPHAGRGAIGEFGAARSGGRVHEGFDVNSPCGTPLLAARGGKVTRARFDPRLYGWYVVIKGRRTRGMRYMYSHLIGRPEVREGSKVRTGQLLGHVGRTGNAASTPCHLHFELRRDGRHLDPEPFLRRWDR